MLKILLCLIAALAALAFAVARRSRRKRVQDIRLDEHRSTIPHGDFSRTIDIEGVKIHYQEKGDGPTLVLIHGFGAWAYTWRKVFEPLSQKFHVIALDLKGFGFSDKPDGDYAITTQADLIEKFLRRLNVKRATLCGNSMGGAIALLMALRHPEIVERLILVDSAAFSLKRSLAPQAVLIPKLGEVLGPLAMSSNFWVQTALERCYYNTALISKEQIAAYYRPLLTRSGQRAALAAGRALHASLPKLGPYILANAQHITKPTLILWGADDQIIPVENAHRLHAAIPSSKLVILEKCGHVPQEEHPEKFLAAVLQFLSASASRD